MAESKSETPTILINRTPKESSHPQLESICCHKSAMAKKINRCNCNCRWKSSRFHCCHRNRGSRIWTCHGSTTEFPRPVSTDHARTPPGSSGGRRRSLVAQDHGGLIWNRSLWSMKQMSFDQPSGLVAPTEDVELFEHPFSRVSPGCE